MVQKHVIPLVLLLLFPARQSRALVLRGYEQPSLAWKRGVHKRIIVPPLAVGDLVFSGTDDGLAFCFSLPERRLCWQRSLGILAGIRPVTSADIVAYKTANEIVALDRSTGTVRWRASCRHSLSNLAADGKRIVSACNPGVLLAVSAGDGKVIWKKSMIEQPSPILMARGQLFYFCKQGTVCRADPATGKTIWSYHTGCADTLALYKGRLLASCMFSTVALDGATGKELWHNHDHHIFLHRGDSELAIFEDQIISFRHDGSYVFQATDIFSGTTREIGKISHRFSGDLLEPFIVLDDTLYAQGYSRSSGQGGDFILGVDLRQGRQTMLAGLSEAPTTHIDARARWHNELLYGAADGLRAFDTTTRKSVLLFRTGGELTSAPVVKKGLVFIGSATGQLHAYRQSDGTMAWLARLNDDGTRVLPPAVTDAAVVTVDSRGTLVALNPQTGTTMWRRRLGLSPIPPVAGGRHVIVVRRRELLAIDDGSGKVSWSYRARVTLGRPAVERGKVYVGTDRNQLLVIDLRRGKLLRTMRVKGSATRPAVGSGRIVVRTDRGYLYCFSAQNGRKLWQRALANERGSDPALDDKQVVLGVGPTVMAFDIATGKERWSFRAVAEDKMVRSPVIVRSRPLLLDNAVYVGSDDETLYALDATNGRKLWRFETAGPVVSHPVSAGRMLLFSSLGGFLYAVKLASANVLWRQMIPAGVAQPLQADGSHGVVFAADREGNLVALQAATGKRLWKKSLSAALSTPLQLTRGMLVGGDWSGMVFMARARDGKMIWVNHTGDSFIKQILLAGNYVLAVSTACDSRFGGDNSSFRCLTQYSHIHAYGLGDGALKWRFGAVTSVMKLVLCGQDLLFYTAEGRVFSINSRSGRLNWKFHSGIRYQGAKPIFTTSVLILPYLDKQGNFMLASVNPETGARIWSTTGTPHLRLDKTRHILSMIAIKGTKASKQCRELSSGKAISCPREDEHKAAAWRYLSSSSADGTTYYLCNEGTLCIYDENRGKERGRVNLPYGFSVPPLPWRNLLILANDSGVIYALDRNALP